MGHLNPNHQWDMHRHSMFLLTPTWARGTGISLKVLHKHLLLRRHARGARAWVKVEDRTHKRGHQAPRGRVYAITPQTKLPNQSVIQGTFLLFHLWTRVLFYSGASHSFIVASCVKNLGLEAETLEN